MTNFTLTILFFLGLFTSPPSNDNEYSKRKQETVILESHLVITEIMYHPNSSDSSWEWIEIYNKGDQTIDLAGYVLDDNNTTKQGSANIIAGTIAGGGVAVLFDADVSVEEFTAVWGDLNVIPVNGWPGLNNSGDSIGIWDSFEVYDGDNITQLNVIEQVVYDDANGWVDSNAASSIFLTDLSSDSTLGSNWALSEIGQDGVIQSKQLHDNTGSDIGSPGFVPIIVDTVPPTIECPETVETNADGGICSAVLLLPMPNASDNVSGEFSFSALRSDGLDLDEPFSVGETVVTWTVTDEANNTSAPCEQLVKVIDAELPTAIAQNITIELDENGNASIDPEDFDNQETPSFDNCGIESYGASRTEFTCADLDTPVFVEFSVIDANGNASTIVEVEVTVIDKLKPTLFCGPDMVNISSNGQSIIVDDIVEPTVSDNCDEAPILSFSRSDERELNVPFEVGTTNILWQAVDASGNVESCKQTITVDFTASVENDILSFSIPAQVGETVIDTSTRTIDVIMPIGTDVTELTPVFEVSEGASSSPELGTSVDFTEPFPYLITAQNELQQLWFVTVVVEEDMSPPTFEVKGNIEDFVTELEVGDSYVVGEISNIVDESIMVSEILGDDQVDTSQQGGPFLVTYSVSDGINTTTITETVLVNGSNQALLAVNSFTLVNADSNEDLFVLVEGMEINMDEIPTLNLDIRANTTDDVQSVRFSLSGEQTTSRTENVFPYALYGDSPAGDYFGNQFILGDYTVTSTAFSESQLVGNSGEELSLNFSIYSACDKASELTTIAVNPSSCQNATGSAVLNTTAQFDVLIGDLAFEKTVEEDNVSYIFEELSPGSYQVTLTSVEGTCENIVLDFEIEAADDCPQTTGNADLIVATYLQGSTNPSPTGPILRAEEGNRETYLKFDLSTFSGPITRAILQMQVASDPGNGTLEVFLGSNSDWTEIGLNGANKPSKIGPALASISGTHDLGRTKRWNLDISQLTSGGELTLIVKHSKGNDVAFASDETNQAPQLMITAGGNGLIDGDGDGFFNDVDCDDNNPAINPEAIEICDGIDNNCDGLIDDQDPEVSCNEIETVADLIDATYLQGSSNPNPTGPILRAEDGKRVTYLKFDLGPITGTIIQAQLKMQLTSDPGNGTLEVFLGSDSNWNETELTGNNKPTEEGAALASITGTHKLGQTKTWNLDVSRLQTNGELTLVLKHSNGNDVAFASDETNQAPRLIIRTEGSGLLGKSVNAMLLTPNPALNETTLSFEKTAELTTIQVFDVTGRLVMTYDAKDVYDNGTYLLDVKSIETGTYFINSRDINGVNYQKQIIVKK